MTSIVIETFSDMMYKNKDDSIRKNEAMEWQDKWTSTLV
jgi:hypothetical protein